MLVQGYGALPTNETAFSDDDDDEGNVFDMVRRHRLCLGYL